jgi:hypothetical protein
MTHPGQARDVDLDAWRAKFAFHPANTVIKQLGHQLARKAVMALAELLHWLVPPGDDKSVAFRLLGDVLMLSNRALATNGGPRIIDGDEAYTQQALEAGLARYGATELPEDPRIREYEADQRREHPTGSPSGHITGMVERDGHLEPVTFRTDDPRAQLGLTGVVVSEAAEPAVYAERPTEDPETFRAEFEDGDVILKVAGGRGYVSVAVLGPPGPPLPDKDGLYGWYTNLHSPTVTNELLSAIAAAGDRAFTVR